MTDGFGSVPITIRPVLAEGVIGVQDKAGDKLMRKEALVSDSSIDVPPDFTIMKAGNGPHFTNTETVLFLEIATVNVNLVYKGRKE